MNKSQPIPLSLFKAPVVSSLRINFTHGSISPSARRQSIKFDGAEGIF